MTRIKNTVLTIALLIAPIALPALADQSTEKFKGEVVALRQQTQNQGADQVIAVRTRNGEQQQFRTGDRGLDVTEAIDGREALAAIR